MFRIAKPRFLPLLVLLFVACQEDVPTGDAGSGGQFKNKAVLEDEALISLYVSMKPREPYANFALTAEGRKYLGLYKNHNLEMDTSGFSAYFKWITEDPEYLVFKRETGRFLSCRYTLPEVSDTTKVDPVLLQYDVISTQGADSGSVIGQAQCGIITEDGWQSRSVNYPTFYMFGHGISLNSGLIFDLGQITILYN
jgi:hypothetical protein